MEFVLFQVAVRGRRFGRLARTLDLVFAISISATCTAFVFLVLRVVFLVLMLVVVLVVTVVLVGRVIRVAVVMGVLVRARPPRQRR